MLSLTNRIHVRKLNVTCSLQKRLTKKYKILNQIERCDKIINKKHKQALVICNQKLDIDVQPLCRHTWEIIENTTIIKSKLVNELICLDNELKNYDINEL
jgi:hypothetical protein